MAASRVRVMTGASVAIAVVAIYLVLFAIIGSAMFARAPDRLSIAVLADLTITAPFVVWWFGVRRGALPAWTIGATVAIGLATARTVLGVDSAPGLASVLFAIDLALMVWLVLRARRIVTVARANRDRGPLEALEAGLVAGRFPKRLSTFMATELVVVWLAFTGWFRSPAPGTLSIHKRAGWMLYCGVFGFLIATETVAVHIVLVAAWSTTAAWVSTALSIYSVIWLVGDAHGLRCFAVSVDREAVRISVGLRWRAVVPVEDITSIVEVNVAPAGALDLALIAPTVVINLRSPIEVRGLLGIRRTASAIALSIDEPAALMACVSGSAPRTACSR